MKLSRLPGICFIALILAIGLAAVSVSAQGSYTYNFNRTAVPGPAVYSSAREIFGEDIGVGALKEPRDIFVSDDNLIYIADSGNNRIVCVDEDFRPVRIIDEFEREGTPDKFRTPTGLFVSKQGIIHIADYGNNRVVLLDSEGSLVRIIANPTDHELIPSGFLFKPLKVVADRAGRVYVIAEGVLEGLLEFDENGLFSGFIGAPRVHPNLWDYMWRRFFMTDAQKERSVMFVPTEYSNIDMDSKGFIYATVAGGTASVRQTIRRLNPSGEDVLRRNGFTPPMGDVDIITREESVNASIVGFSSLVDIVVREHGIYSVVDRLRGRIFTYDDNGNLLYAFGTPSYERGAFRTPGAIERIGDNLLVLDSRLNLVSVLEPTEYAKAIHGAIGLYQVGDYDGSMNMWSESLKHDPNLDIAYSGIGRALLRQGDFMGAMDAYRLGSDRSGYSQALRLYRREWINANFGSAMTVIILLIILAGVIKWVQRRKQAGVEQEYVGLAVDESKGRFDSYIKSLKYAFHVIVHPADGFWDLKHEGRGNVLSASTILIMVIITYIAMRQYTGFVFNYNDPRQLNIYLELASVLLPFLLWCAVNLGLTSLMEGKGNFRDIYIATAYALTPLILINIPLILLSNVIILEEGAFYYVAGAIAVVWTGFLLIIGTQITHEYETGKNLITNLLTVVGMQVVIFIGLLFLSVLAQLYGFLDTVYTEIAFRI